MQPYQLLPNYPPNYRLAKPPIHIFFWCQTAVHACACFLFDFFNIYLSLLLWFLFVRIIHFVDHFLWSNTNKTNKKRKIEWKKKRKSETHYGMPALSMFIWKFVAVTPGICENWNFETNKWYDILDIQKQKTKKTWDPSSSDCKTLRPPSRESISDRFRH